jgi:hypothetical protein
MSNSVVSDFIDYQWKFLGRMGTAKEWKKFLRQWNKDNKLKKA